MEIITVEELLKFVQFRRYRQEFLDLVVPTMERDSGVYQPTVTKHSAEKQIALNNPVAAKAAAAEPKGRSN